MNLQDTSRRLTAATVCDHALKHQRFERQSCPGGQTAGLGLNPCVGPGPPGSRRTVARRRCTTSILKRHQSGRGLPQSPADAHARRRESAQSLLSLCHAAFRKTAPFMFYVQSAGELHARLPGGRKALRTLSRPDRVGGAPASWESLPAEASACACPHLPARYAQAGADRSTQAGSGPAPLLGGL